MSRGATGRNPIPKTACGDKIAEAILERWDELREENSPEGHVVPAVPSRRATHVSLFERVPGRPVCTSLWLEATVIAVASVPGTRPGGPTACAVP